VAASSRLMTSAAERRFPARIKIAVPPKGLGAQLDLMTAWLDANCGAENWAIAPAGIRGIANDALAICFIDAALASAFVARWCLGYRAAPVDGSYHVRDDEQAPRVPAPAHRTP
jgi:hypothetical protein